jgi:hypothetical protein
VAVQESLHRFVDLFARMGLQMNAAKTEAMVYGVNPSGEAREDSGRCL